MNLIIFLGIIIQSEEEAESLLLRAYGNDMRVFVRVEKLKHEYMAMSSSIEKIQTPRYCQIGFFFGYKKDRWIYIFWCKWWHWDLKYGGYGSSAVKKRIVLHGVVQPLVTIFYTTFIFNILSIYIQKFPKANILYSLLFWVVEDVHIGCHDGTDSLPHSVMNFIRALLNWISHTLCFFFLPFENQVIAELAFTCQAHHYLLPTLITFTFGKA